MDLEDTKNKLDSNQVKSKQKSAKNHARLKINGGKRIRNRVLCPKYKVQWSEEDVSGNMPPNESSLGRQAPRIGRLLWDQLVV